jgi:hypothetical protein
LLAQAVLTAIKAVAVIVLLAIWMARSRNCWQPWRSA